MTPLIEPPASGMAAQIGLMTLSQVVVPWMRLWTGIEVFEGPVSMRVEFKKDGASTSKSRVDGIGIGPMVGFFKELRLYICPQALNMAVRGILEGEGMIISKRSFFKRTKER